MWFRSRRVSRKLKSPYVSGRLINLSLHPKVYGPAFIKLHGLNRSIYEYMPKQARTKFVYQTIIERASSEALKRCIDNYRKRLKWRVLVVAQWGGKYPGYRRWWCNWIDFFDLSDALYKKGYLTEDYKIKREYMEYYNLYEYERQLKYGS